MLEKTKRNLIILIRTCVAASSVFFLSCPPYLRDNNRIITDDSWPLAYQKLWDARGERDIDLFSSEENVMSRDSFYIGGGRHTAPTEPESAIFRFDMEGRNVSRYDIHALAQAHGFPGIEHDMVQFAFLDRGNLYAISEQWRIDSQNHRVFCLDTQTGAFKWGLELFEFGKSIFQVPMAEIWGPYIIFFNLYYDDQDRRETKIFVVPRDSPDGRPLIVRRLSGDVLGILNGNVHGDFLYQRTNWNPLLIIDLNKLIDPAVSDGDIIAFREPTPEGKTFAWNNESNVVFTDDLYIYNRYGNIVARRLSNNQEVWCLDLMSENIGGYGLITDNPMQISGNKLLFPTYHGMILCIEVSTGDELWRKPVGPWQNYDPQYHTQYITSQGVVAEGRWFIMPNGPEQVITVFDIESGERLLCFPYEDYGTAVRNGSFYRDGIFYQIGMQSLQAFSIRESR